MNRVSGVLGASQIYGKINANGHVWILNPEGVHFHSSSKVNVAGVLASTYNIATENFMNANYEFEKFSGNHDGFVKNAGELRVSSLAALLSHDVENVGYIYAQIATVVLGSNPTFVLDVYGNDTINFAVSDELLQRKAVASHDGQIYADGGRVFLTVDQAEGVINNVINMTGAVHADTVNMQDGVIVLSGGNSSLIDVRGELSAKGVSKNETGGRIHLLGELVGLFDHGKIDVSGKSRGGEILVGGDYKGEGDTPTAKSTYIGVEADLIADAHSGDAGKIIVWSDGYTAFHGDALARALGETGDGGFVETSGKAVLNATNSADVSSANGKGGTWLLDPYDLEIVLAGGINTGGSPFESSAAISEINASLIVDALESGDVIIQTGSSGGDAGNIILSTDLSYSYNNVLTLNAINNIEIADGVTLKNSGSADLVLRADFNGDGVGTLEFNSSGEVDSIGDVKVYYNPESFGTPDSFSEKIIGTGSLTDYMLVNTLSNLQAMDNPLYLDKNFALGADIDASSAGFTPIGDQSDHFTGNFDGQNFTISSLNISIPSTSGVGLFGHTSGAIIENINLVDSDIKGNFQLGALVGYAHSETIIKNASSTGSVESIPQDNAYDFGLLVGRADGAQIIDSDVSGSVKMIYLANTIKANIGGLVGYLDNKSSITNSTATDVVVNGVETSGIPLYYPAINNIGGLVGYAINGSIITGSSVSGSVLGSLANVGGLVGKSEGSYISDSHSTASVEGRKQVGGLVGLNLYGAITGSHATGSITISTPTAGGLPIDLGGLVGNNDNGSITDSFSTGSIVAETANNVGGLVGVNKSDSSVSRSYATGDVLGKDFVGGLVGADLFNTTIENAYALGRVQLVA